jgi:hypothetical protein
MMARTDLPVHPDGYQWQRDVISHPGSYTLVGPDGGWVAHVYRCDNRTWRAVRDDGELILDGFRDSGSAMKAAEQACRPCAYVDTDLSHGVVDVG